MRTPALLSLSAAALLAWPLRPGAGSASAGIAVGDEFPDIEVAAWLNFPDGAGTIHDLRGHVVLIDFWRTW